MVTKAQKKANQQKRGALFDHLKTNPNPDVESLSRSYGLPINEVQKMVEASNG